MIILPPMLQTISQALQEHNARAVVVGGAVRDHLQGTKSKDYDIEVYGIDSLDKLGQILDEYGRVNYAGRSFGVAKLICDDLEYDFSLPRSETKSGIGHRGFDIMTDGRMSFACAARRRDFTINAMGYDIISGEILDPYGGLEDMEHKLLRHIDNETFVEDSLRVYRAVQFAARFGYELSDQTLKLCKDMVTEGMLDELPRERSYVEWQKLLLKAPKPSLGLKLMRELGIIERYFPELCAIINVPQDPRWHPEGDVWTHTLMALDVMQSELEIRDKKTEIGDRDRLRFMFAILCHDLGKATHTTIEFVDGISKNWIEVLDNHHINDLSDEQRVRITSHTDILHAVKLIRALGHEKAGVEPTRSLLYRFTNEHKFVESILPLVEHHLKPSQFYSGRAKPATIRRLATKVNISELVMVAKADFLGRSTEDAGSGVYEAGEWLQEQADRLNVQMKPLDNILHGSDLIAMGLKPSRLFGEILDEVYCLYLDGELTSKDEAIEYAKGCIREPLSF